MSIKVAIIGAGYMAGEHARAFTAQPGVSIVGVVGRTPKRAKELADQYGAPVYRTIHELWSASSPDVVVVAVNELSMAAVAGSVFRHPWLVLLEKPVGLDLADARRIKADAVANGADRRTWVGLNRRSYSATREALARISEAGSRLVSVLDQQDMESVRSLGTPEAVVQNYMYANSIHLIDYFSVFCRGELERVQVTAPWEALRPGHVIATLDWSSGDRGVYQAIWNGPGPWAVSVATPDARFEMRPLETLTVQPAGERRATPVELDLIDSAFKPGLHVQAAEMVRAAAGERIGLASLEQAVDSMDLCARIYGLA